MPRLIRTGVQFPPQEFIPLLAKYERGRIIHAGRQAEICERAAKYLKDTPHADALNNLLIAVNLMEIIVGKPADLLVAEPPVYESGFSDDAVEQRRLNSIVEENDLNQRIHEATIGAGFRGDAWLKTYYAYRQDFSDIPAGYEPPDSSPEPIIEAVDASYVFPEFSKGSRKRFKAVNIAYVEHVEDALGNEKASFLNVERHTPGFIEYERYKVEDAGVNNEYDVPIPTYIVGERVATGRDEDIEETGVPHLLVHHIPYKTDDEQWNGVSAIEKLESVLAAINDRLVMIDYVIHKNGSPTAYGPEIEGVEGVGQVALAHAYIPIGEKDPVPGYMTIDGALDAAFKELDILISLVFQMSETPQWVFGQTVTGNVSGGTGTSHTDSGAILARFFPLLSKVKRIRVHVDKAIRDAIYTAMLLENAANEGVAGWTKYDAPYPKIRWKDGIPRNRKEEAEIMSVRTGGKPTISVFDAIKQLDDVDDEKATESLDRIDDDEERMNGTVDAKIFNEPNEGAA